MTRQQEIFNYICNNPVPAPTVREIAKAVGLKSSSSVHVHLIKLKESGLITWDPKFPRTIRVEQSKRRRKKKVVSV